jgi:hypothetical protein
MKAAAAPMSAQWRTQAAWIDTALNSGTQFLQGDAPGIADVAAYMNVWFLTTFTPHLATPLMEGFDRLEAWRERLKAIGHGQRSEMTPAEALDVARTSEPAETAAHDAADPLRPGQLVAVAADDYGRDPIHGRLVAANRVEVVIAREDKSLGRVIVHFPRVGYLVTSQA